MLLKALVTIFLIANPWLAASNPAVLSAVNQNTELAAITQHSSANLEAVVNEALAVETTKTSKTDAFVQAQANPDFLPIRDWSVEEPSVDGKAAIVFDTYQDKILFKYNINEVLPIASVTKIMTAVIVIENLKLDRVVDVSPEAYNAPGQMGSLVANEKITVRSLLYAMLMESSNDAAWALAEAVGKDKFMKLMNQKATELQMTNSNFTDPSGFDAETKSTISDLVRLTKFSLTYPFIWEILGTKNITLRSADGQFDHKLTNNNTLLSRMDNVVGGKTGYTEQAQGCMIVVTSLPSQENIITIILGSSDRMGVIEKLVKWIDKAYLWE